MLSSTFITAWREWLRRPVPAANFRMGRTRSPAYEIEHDIDHSVSYVHGLVENFIAGKQLDFTNLASSELAEIEKLRTELNNSELNNEDKEEYLSYLNGMTLILEELKQTARTS